jgi:hypothetical protein
VDVACGLWHVASMGEVINSYRSLVWKPEGRRPLGRPVCRGEDILKWFLEWWGGIAGTRLAWLTVGTRNSTEPWVP